MELSPAREGGGPSWRARSEGEILLSPETKGLLCVMVSGWGGVGWGEGKWLMGMRKILLEKEKERQRERESRQVDERERPGRETE